MMRRLVCLALCFVLSTVLAGCSRQSVTDFSPYPGEAAMASGSAALGDDDHEHDHEEDHDHEA